MHMYYYVRHYAHVFSDPVTIYAHVLLCPLLCTCVIVLLCPLLCTCIMMTVTMHMYYCDHYYAHVLL